jgi:short subunit dehydrogenase-like uncharacterized protein
MSFLLYGANGYTGKLIIQKAIQKGLQPVLAGRTESKIKPLAEANGLPYLVFGLDNVAEITAHLQGFPVVLNCAGPFSRTARPMVEACLQTNTHYLDITGEIEVFEMVKSYHAKALEKGIVLMSGVGFDVVPTDCLAVYLHEKLPDATHLELAISGLGGSISHGTLSTMIESLGKAGAVRENGKIIAKPVGHHGKWINFGQHKQFAITIPWGDVSTAFYSTGIPNIEVYTTVPWIAYYILKMQALFNPLLRSKFFKGRLQRYVDNKITGPTPSQSEKGKSRVWGRVFNAQGKQVEALLEGPEGYLLTAETSLNLVRKMLVPHKFAGYHTPAGLFGHTLILEVPGTKLVSVVT